MLPSPPGIRITLACGAFGLISTAREPPILTVSSAMAGAHARPASIATAPKQPIHPYLFIFIFSMCRRLLSLFPSRLDAAAGGDRHRHIPDTSQLIMSVKPTPPPNGGTPG